MESMELWDEINTIVCICAGLKRRALGLFKTNSTTALIQKISKDNADADDVMRRVAEIEQVSHCSR